MKQKSIRIRKQPHTACNQCPIRKLALFQGIPPERLEWTQKYRDQQFVVPAKTLLYHEESVTDYVYTLFDGWMAMHQTSREGKRQILRFALPGDFIGFQTDQKGMVSHSVSALTESIVCGFPRSRLQEMLEENPTLALRLASMGSKDMNLCQQHQAFRSRKDAYESIAFLLLELFHRTREHLNRNYDPETNSVVFPPTQEDIGDAVGLTNVHVNRILRQFRNLGLIECHHKRLYILDEEKLADMGEFDKSMVC
ncbi:MAG: Crp/Fnr family transcriptional regulator [gamma proteobacterium symbiont of Taylorina sp.]|nr:Crp/Fnr family transcriptional regulator [gamma proteobacterium symbiont of Taylorina sp.]